MTLLFFSPAHPIDWRRRRSWRLLLISAPQSLIVVLPPARTTIWFLQMIGTQCTLYSTPHRKSHQNHRQPAFGLVPSPRCGHPLIESWPMVLFLLAVSSNQCRGRCAGLRWQTWWSDNGDFDSRTEVPDETFTWQTNGLPPKLWPPNR